MVSHVFAAFRAPIQDCDETFNYWEPLHYLNHGYGLQTWEYSPDYSLRSWAYILIHALPAKVMGFLGHSKLAEFYGLRIILAVVCAASEVRLYSAICRTLNPRIGVFYLTIAAFTPGFFYASVAFLPSSFAMYASTLGLTAFMDWHGGTKTATGIMWFGIGALLGWPFAGALIIPFVIEDWTTAIWMGTTPQLFPKYLDGTVRCLIVLAIQTSIDAFFYHKLTIVPLRLVLYNIFSDPSRGPAIFGTEPWHYYPRNLLLNFNLFFLLALASFPLLIIQSILLPHGTTTRQTLLRTLFLLTPFYLWLTIFTLQPHKEERFLYPAYPFLALNASIALHMLLTWLGSSNPRTLIGRIPPRLKLALILPILLTALNISLLRTLGTITAYQAPLNIYSALPTQNITEGDTLCLGKDWYRLPSSHFLPTPIHARFVRSHFHGLLPGQFSEAKTGFGLFPGTWLVPSGMNDINKEDPGKYVDVGMCTWLVDTHMEGDVGDEEEPVYVKDEVGWERVKCERFLDTERSGAVGRMLWVPDLGGLDGVGGGVFRRRWGEHCLLRRREGIL